MGSAHLEEVFLSWAVFFVSHGGAGYINQPLSLRREV